MGWFKWGGGGGWWLIYGKHGIFKSRSPTLLTLYFWVEWLVWCGLSSMYIQWYKKPPGSGNVVQWYPLTTALYHRDDRSTISQLLIYINMSASTISILTLFQEFMTNAAFSTGGLISSQEIIYALLKKKPIPFKFYIINCQQQKKISSNRV